MNIRDLKYLCAVADLGHFGKAAEACFVSQPTLSMQLKKLEEELGVTLFERSNKQVLITDIGKQVVDRARRVLVDVEELICLAKGASSPFDGKIKLGVIPTVAPYLLPHVTPLIKETYPELTLLLIEEKTPVLMDLLHQGKIDAALMALPIEHDFDYKVIANEPFYFACAKTNLLAKKKSINYEDLDKYPVMLLQEGHCLRDHAMDVCERAHVHKLADFSATSLETLRLMVAADNGVTLLPALSVINQKTSNLAVLPFRDSIPTRQLALFWRKTSYLKESLEELVDLLATKINPLLKG